MNHRIRTFYHLSIREHTTYIDIIVENQNIRVFSLLKSSFMIGYAHNPRRSFRSHTHGIGQRNARFLNHRLNQPVHGGDASGQ